MSPIDMNIRAKYDVFEFSRFWAVWKRVKFRKFNLENEGKRHRRFWYGSKGFKPLIDLWLRARCYASKYNRYKSVEDGEISNILSWKWRPICWRFDWISVGNFCQHAWECRRWSRLSLVHSWRMDGRMNVCPHCFRHTFQHRWNGFALYFEKLWTIKITLFVENDANFCNLSVW